MRASIRKEVEFADLLSEQNKEVASGVFTLEKISKIDLKLNIPIYQRLYVWKNDQIRTLLIDLKNACFNEKEKDPSYFLGGVMLSRNKDHEIDLVDGQQRFTTLWLLCDILGKENSLLQQFTHCSTEPRIRFSIRKEAQAFLKNPSSFNKYLSEKGEIRKEFKDELSEIIPLVNARDFIIGELKEFVKDEKFSNNEFSKFLFSKVKLTYTFMPEGIDMNRVFEAMNNRGKQLRNHEILKSELLRYLDDTEKSTYGIIWDVCSDMGAFIEKSLKDVASLEWKSIFSHTSLIKDKNEQNIKKKYSKDLTRLNIVELLQGKSNEANGNNLLDILKMDGKNLEKEDNTEIEESKFSSRTVRSIISFPMFLLHALRVFQKKYLDIDAENSATINEKKLIESFNLDCFKDKEKIKQFIEDLWKLRVLFDKYIVKWIKSDDNNSEFHWIDKLSINWSASKEGSTSNDLSIQRIEQKRNFRDLVMLSGMLYHSQEMTTQYWLTPFLHFLINSESISTRKVLQKFEQIEHYLLYQNIINRSENDLRIRSYEILSVEDAVLGNQKYPIEPFLKKEAGTSYPSYIFYKLEYVLWKNKDNLCKEYNLDINQWNDYKMTSKNSVEHVFPQKSKEENKHIEYFNDAMKARNPDSSGSLDDFGNLVLLSSQMNSTYSNKSFKEKKGKFEGKEKLDSLKSALIFKEDSWDYEKAILHRDEMIRILDEYLT